MEPLESFSQSSWPNDVIYEILSRLPVKNLLRFRAVCRSWRELISNPVFINSHLRNYHRHNWGTIRNALLDHKKAPRPRPCICQGASGRDEPVHEFIRDFSANAGDDHRWRVIFCRTHFSFAGCCNGLICFFKLCEYNNDMHIYLWNPALNQFRVLPESNYNGKNFCFRSITVCLVYNAVTNDYQVVKILYLRKSGICKAEIYTLSTNSWKPLISEFFPNKEKHFSNLFYWDGVVHNGFPHWLARCENLPSALCVLDMNEEKIHEIPLPEEVYKREDSRLELFQGCLSILCGLFKRNEKFELWVLKEQGKDISWIKKTVVPGDLGINLLHHRTTEVTGNIFASDRRSRLVSYDLENERVAEELSQDDDIVLRWPNFCYYVVDYVASLISLASVI